MADTMEMDAQGLDHEPRRHVKLYDTQLDQLWELNDPTAFPLFIALLSLGSCHGTRAFKVSVHDLIPMPGLGGVEQARAKLDMLQHAGLVSIVTHTPDPMVIRIVRQHG